MLNFNNTSNCLNEDILKTLEKTWGFKVPEDYRSFLLKFNGGYPDKTFFHFLNDQENGSVLNAFMGIRPDDNLNLLKDIQSYKGRIPSNFLPIADDAFGNLILISVKNSDRGKIYFWDHELEADEGEVPDYSNLTLIADSFTEFVENLKDETEVDSL